MKFIATIFIATSLFFTSCERVHIEKHVPSCVKKQIREFNGRSMCGNEHVEEYFFQGMAVYVFFDGSCVTDGGAFIIDADCNYLGFSRELGSQMVNGEDFSNAVFIRTVWTKQMGEL